MRTIIKFIFMLLCSGLFAQHGDIDLFLNYFNKIELPINTNLYNRFFEKELPYSLALKHIFKNDTVSSFYSYEIYSNDDNTLTESGEKQYKILPINYYKSDSIYLITYYKGSITGESGCFISMLDKEGILLDNLLIYKEENENELWYWVRAKILLDSIKCYEYSTIPKKKRINNEITSINISKYLIDTSQKKFIFLNDEKYLSSLYLYEFYEGNNELIFKEDPFYK